MTRGRTALYAVLVALLVVAVGVVTNLATSNVPNWIERRPWLPWTALGVLTLGLVSLAVVQVREALGDSGRGVKMPDRPAEEPPPSAAGPPPPMVKPPQPYFAHPYPLQENFTGRVRERQMLSEWLTADDHPVLALVAMGGLSFTLGNRLSDAETRAGTALEILSLMRSPGAEPVRLAPQGETPASSGLVEVSAPSVRTLYLASEDFPEPASGMAYQLWLGADGQWFAVGPMFRPEDGVVLLKLEDVDTSFYDAIWITEEVAGAVPQGPSTGGHSWRAEL